MTGPLACAPTSILLPAIRSASRGAARQNALYRGQQIDIVGRKAVGICGRQDAITLLSSHEEMAAGIRGARLEVLEECGHLSTLEKPAEVNAALREWLEGMGP